jgi:hypothetical protein
MATSIGPGDSMTMAGAGGDHADLGYMPVFVALTGKGLCLSAASSVKRTTEAKRKGVGRRRARSSPHQGIPFTPEREGEQPSPSSRRALRLEDSSSEAVSTSPAPEPTGR